MINTAPFRNPPPGLPHDPIWMMLDGRDGWPIADSSSDIAVSPLDCALTLQVAPGGSGALADPSGRFGGLVPPPNVTLSRDGTVWLLNKTTGKLRRFDDCACAFVDVPCTAGIGKGPRQLVAPTAIAARGHDLLVLDAGPPGRVLVFAAHGFALRAIWAPPKSAVPKPWQPSAIAVAPDGRTYVADIENGAIHLFDRGGTWRAAWTGFGAVAAIAADRFNRVYTWVPGQTTIQITGPDGKPVGTPTDVDSVRDCFPKLPDFASDATGRINLAGRCATAGWFDPSGQPSTASPSVPPTFAASGTWISTALDSRIGRCQWHRVLLAADVPTGAGLTIQTWTSEAAQPDELVAALPATAWTTVPLAAPPSEALILSAPGRYLWLRASLTGSGQNTPRLHKMRIEYPRISLRRYLPAAFAPDPVSADFTDRLLAIFDTGFRSVETEIDNQAALFDPRSAPATSPVKGAPDMLTWLASWIGVTFDRAWPIERRRAYLLNIAKLFPCRGTLPGLRRLLLLFLGLGPRPTGPAPACGASCAPRPPAWLPPPLILEHWKIRRWLFLGAGRLGDDAVLWGDTITGRSQLGNTAQLGVTHLNTSEQAIADPFNVDAYAFTVFVPGGLARTQQAKGALQRLLSAEAPAWSAAKLRFVLPRMRIGIQACIGFDSVVGCWPEGVILDSAALGRGTVLSAAPNIDPGPHLGRNRIGNGARIA